MQAIFYPPLSTQRYQWVEGFLLQSRDIESVTDVGCGNGRMINWLKSVPHLSKVNCLDSDNLLLECELDRYFRPNLYEMVFGRRNSQTSFNINVFHGDIVVPDDRLRSDCFTIVEMIEHIPLNKVSDLSRTIFSYYRPKYVIVTTPNIEMNPAIRELSFKMEQEKLTKTSSELSPGKTFPNPKNNFRHHDHKFEWNRQQFLEWARIISRTYGYEFMIDGVGYLAGYEHLGPSTQIALFKRQTTESNASSSIDCFDLLLNKLSVEESIRPEFDGDASLKRICLIAGFKMPGKRHELEKVASSPVENDEEESLCDVYDERDRDVDFNTILDYSSPEHPSSQQNRADLEMKQTDSGVVWW